MKKQTKRQINKHTGKLINMLLISHMETNLGKQKGKRTENKKKLAGNCESNKKHETDLYINVV